MSERALSFAIYWGIWLILPALIDGVTTFVQIVQVMVHRIRVRNRQLPPASGTAGVSIIVPVYNGERTLGRCLDALMNQNYPQELIEIIVVDNGSTDGTAQVFQETFSRPFRGQMHWVSIYGRGKSYALNAGLHLSTCPYVCNVDADTLLHPDAIAEMLRHFEANPKLGAATGTIQVLPTEKAAGDENRLAFLIAECEFHEYLTAFWLGRQGQSISSSLYTLAGAFSFFRREVLLRTLLYDKQTVSEDTKVTFDVRLQFGGEGLGCVPQAVGYITPTPSLSALYAQRVRWQRGELEVAALHQNLLHFNLTRVRGLSLSRMLLIDHTFLFPRLVWTFLFPALAFYRYPLSLVINALLIIYIFYVGLAIISALAVYSISTPTIRTRIVQNYWVMLFIPLYRMLTYVYRLAGSIVTLTEPAEWRVQDPWSEIQSSVRQVRAIFHKKTRKEEDNGIRNV